MTAIDKPLLKTKRKLQQDLEHINQEMYKRNVELAEINRTLSLLRTIDTLVLESQDDLPALCRKMAHAIIAHSDFTLAAIFAKAEHHSHLELYGLAGENYGLHHHHVPKVHIDPSAKWLHHKELQPFNVETMSDKEIANFLQLTLSEVVVVRQQMQVKSIYPVKLQARQQLVGVMVIGFGHAASEAGRHKTLLERLGEAVGVAVDNKLLFRENQEVLQKLKHSNDKLRALDETKDEFISMASHQLRTPLTSVKGYVSMVLEGDAGKLGKQQKELLNQAFTSSQRMVYLIADLLNVSRLKTGKFVIENKPTNLADVVEGEIGQLIETAKAKNLELTYKKPAKFPLLDLDETKIRQVIMNFADNAIYYTPAGGHVQVSLSDTGSAVEFTVVDDGLGVPKAEQRHLFTKFYRAANARKARPDGTGLGLFMAQKVIAAQGGAIIFKSEEGKGSTFGFSFPKGKLLAKTTKKVSK